MARIAHLSDIHFGEAEPEALAAAHAALWDLRLDCIVITGDLTDGGRRREYAAAARWLATLPAPIVACPGNHDAPVFALHLRVVRPFQRFDALGLIGVWAAPDGAVAISAANSARGLQARLDWSQGVYCRTEFAAAARRAAAAAPAGWRLIACHHPPETPPGSAIAVRTRGAADALHALAPEPRTILLCGHVHRFTVQTAGVDRPAVVTAPTLASPRVREDGQGFLLLEATGAALTVQRFVRRGTRMWDEAPTSLAGREDCLAAAAPDGRS